MIRKRLQARLSKLLTEASALSIEAEKLMEDAYDAGFWDEKTELKKVGNLLDQVKEILRGCGL